MNGEPLYAKGERRSCWDWKGFIPEEVEAKWPTLTEESKWVAKQ